ncbi:MAG: hypothetical protein JNM75_08210 [Rhodospirillales bacterium]|nr:hypothetical protein [Rhodospirillales bacterium]
MKRTSHPTNLVRSVGAAAFIFGILALSPTMGFAPSARAQNADMTGIGQSETVVMTATVQSIDYAKRTLTLVGPEGATKTMKVGSEVRNFDQIQPGDTLLVHFREAAVYMIAPPGTKVPEDAIAAAVARAAPGELPAAGAAERVIVTGLVTGVDPAANTISLVDPSGGMVRTLAVKNPDYRKELPSIKVGDTITAVITEAVIAAVEPAG